MIHPRRLDGAAINVVTVPYNGIFVDAAPEHDRGGNIVGRGGPEHSRHYHRFDSYGLADGLVRCRKCGLVRHDDNL